MDTKRSVALNKSGYQTADTKRWMTLVAGATAVQRRLGGDDPLFTYSDLVQYGRHEGGFSA